MKRLSWLFQLFVTCGISVVVGGQDVPTLNLNHVLEILQIVKNMNSKMEAIDNKMLSLDGKVTSLDGKVSSLDGRMTSLDGKVSSLDGRMTSFDGKMSSFDGKMTSFDGKMTSLEDKMTSFDGKMTSLDDKMSTIEENISSSNGRLMSVEDKIILMQGQLSGSSNLDVLHETFEDIFEREREIQRQIVETTCTKTQVENLQHLLATDECIDGHHNCSVTSHCKDTLIGFRCTCHSGYSGDGVECQDIDECDSGTNNCSCLAHCLNSDGGFECSCLPGYTGDGFHCKDIDECVSDTNSCSSHSICSNTEGSYQCICHSGYSGDGFNCQDVDECTDQDDACDIHSDCINTVGSFNCLCHSGYTGDGVTCTPYSCEEPSKFINKLGCLTSVPGARTWDAAQTNCKNSFGGRLVEITTQKQLDLLKEHFQDKFNTHWIGFRMEWSQGGGEGGYPIDPNSPLWAEGQPQTGTRECVYASLVDSRPSLKVFSCTGRSYLICQKQ